MKRVRLLLLVLIVVLGFSGVSSADLITIGTATYGGTNYNLIYEDDQGLVWLDYTKDSDNWANQVSWAAGLGAALTINLNPGVNVTWGGDWRLPTTAVEEWGYNFTSSEMGHLYYSSLEKNAGGPLGDPDPFEKLLAYDYWSGTELIGLLAVYAWNFSFSDGNQVYYYKYNDYYALVVRPGEVGSAPVPEPATMLLLGAGLVGLAGFRRRFEK